MIEVQIGLTAAIVWGFAHALQQSALSYNPLVVKDGGYQVCNAVRILAMVTTAGCFLIWMWTHIPAILGAVCG